MKKIFLIFLTVIFSFSLAQGVFASQYVELPLSDQAEEADIIFLGKALNLEKQPTDPQEKFSGLSFREETITFQIIRVIAGNFEGSKIDVTFERDPYGDNLDFYGQSEVVVFAKWKEGVLSAHPSADVHKAGSLSEWKIKFYYFMHHEFPIPFSYFILLIYITIIAAIILFFVFVIRKFTQKEKKT